MLESLPKIQYRPFCSAESFSAEFDGKICRVEAPGKICLEASVEGWRDRLRMRLGPVTNELGIPVALDYLFSHLRNMMEAQVMGNMESVFRRDEFYQVPGLWRAGVTKYDYPQRPPLQEGVRYRRYVPQLGATLSFRTLDIAKDLEIFHEWHHQPRVYDLWELNKPKEELKAYLEKGLKDPHQIPMIFEVNGQSTGYFEFYWAAEDRIAPYYEFDLYDRGLHFLIGDPKFLGLGRTDAALRSALHFLYLDDPRTKRVVAEPRSDNQRVLKYVQIVPGWQFIKEFDFPHKRAALLMNHRHEFFVKDTL